MEKYYVVQIVGEESYYNGSNLQYEPIRNENFDGISLAMLFNSEEEALDVVKTCKEVFEYLTIKTIYLS